MPSPEHRHAIAWVLVACFWLSVSAAFVASSIETPRNPSECVGPLAPSNVVACNRSIEYHDAYCDCQSCQPVVQFCAARFAEDVCQLFASFGYCAPGLETSSSPSASAATPGVGVSATESSSRSSGTGSSTSIGGDLNGKERVQAESSHSLTVKLGLGIGAASCVILLVLIVATLNRQRISTVYSQLKLRLCRQATDAAGTSHVDLEIRGPGPTPVGHPEQPLDIADNAQTPLLVQARSEADDPQQQEQEQQPPIIPSVTVANGGVGEAAEQNGGEHPSRGNNVAVQHIF